MTTKSVVGLLFISSVTVHCFITINNNNIGGGHKHIATLTTTASAASSSTTLLQPLTRTCNVISSATSSLSSLSPFQLFFALPVDSEVDTDDDDADEDNNYETKLEEARREMMGLQLKNDNLHKKEEEEKKSEEVAAEVEDNGTYFASVKIATLSEEASHDDEGNDDDDGDGDDKVDDGRNTNSISSSSSSTDDDSTSKNNIDIDTATLSKAVDTFVAVGKNVANNLKSQQESNKALDTFVAIAKDVSQDLLSVLRFSAANIITSSLPDNQRQELLQRLGSSSNSVGVLPPEKAETGEQQRASIQEEIALARAEEAALSEQQWNTEKEQIMQQMEQAANERVQNELEVQKMRLEQEQEQQRRIEEEEEETGTKSNSKKIKKKELELLQEQGVEERLKLEELFEKRKNQEQELDVVENNLRLRVAAIEQQKEQFVTLSSEVETLQHKQEVTSLLSNDDGKKEKVSEENIEEEICVVHPVLGPVVADLGYKRLHFASSGALGTIPVWNRNR